MCIENLCCLRMCGGTPPGLTAIAHIYRHPPFERVEVIRPFATTKAIHGYVSGEADIDMSWSTSDTESGSQRFTMITKETMHT